MLVFFCLRFNLAGWLLVRAQPVPSSVTMKKRTNNGVYFLRFINPVHTKRQSFSKLSVIWDKLVIRISVTPDGRRASLDRSIINNQHNYYKYKVEHRTNNDQTKKNGKSRLYWFIFIPIWPKFIYIYIWKIIILLNRKKNDQKKFIYKEFINLVYRNECIICLLVF